MYDGETSELSNFYDMGNLNLYGRSSILRQNDGKLSNLGGRENPCLHNSVLQRYLNLCVL